MSTSTTEELRAIVAEAVTAATEPLRLHVHRLAGIVQSRLAMPVDSLTTAEAMDRIKCSETTLRRLLAKRIFTDVRCGKTRGAEWKLLADEVDVYRLEGADALAVYRQQMGRV